MHGGVTALQRAADRGHLAVVSALLDARAQAPPH
jgi:ankyrin repeat protein